MAVPDGIFFDEKEMLAMGWPLGVVQMLRRVFESDAVNLQVEIDNNTASIVILQANKANKISSAVLGNIVSQLSDGDIQDSGVASSQVTTNASDITTLNTVVANKVDKVGSAVLDNIATLLANGNIQDSGFKTSDLVMIVGTGNPNTIVTSNESRQFFDTAGGIQYNNPAVGVNTGWVAI